MKRRLVKGEQRALDTLKFLKARLAAARQEATRLIREVEYLEDALRKRGVKRP